MLSQLNIKENYNLRAFNTFGLEARAKFFIEILSENDLHLLFQSAFLREHKLLILGGGSNILFTKDFNGFVIHINLKGIEVLEEDEESAVIKAYAGENWHPFVLFCINKGLGGIENLSLIPGKVGAAPMQNIGAYGVEIKDVLESVEAYKIETGQKKIFHNKDCQFGYRTSIFKTALKDKFIITAITLKLSKRPVFNISYGAIKETLREMGISKDELDIRAISNAVISIRQSKLPDPKVIGNAGSFFKNPVIPKHQFEQLKKQYPDIKGYEVNENEIKVPAGWMIEKLGWKGKKLGGASVHEKQALVLVNLDHAKGKDIINLATQIQSDVKKNFGIDIEPEVNII